MLVFLVFFCLFLWNVRCQEACYGKTDVSVLTGNPQSHHFIFIKGYFCNGKHPDIPNSILTTHSKDGSGSMLLGSRWPDTLDFIRAIIDKFNIGDDYIQMGINQFGFDSCGQGVYNNHWACSDWTGDTTPNPTFTACPPAETCHCGSTTDPVKPLPPCTGECAGESYTPDLVSRQVASVKWEELLTGSRSDLNNAVDAMTLMEGGTPLWYGVQHARTEYLSARGRAGVQKFVIALTDGDTYCSELDPRYRDLVDGDGGFVFAIGNEDAIQSQLDVIASHPSFARMAANSAQLAGFVDTIVDAACMDVFEVTPDEYCLDEGGPRTFNIRGTGFVQIRPPLYCKFFGSVQVSATFTPGDTKNMVCVMPWSVAVQNAVDNRVGDWVDVSVEVSVNGGSVWSVPKESKFFYNCSQPTLTDKLKCLDPSVETCKGQSEIIFVLDNSNSVNPFEYNVLKEFTFNVTEKLCVDPAYQRVSVIQFTTGCQGALAHVEFDLDGDRKYVLEQIGNLGRCGIGGNAETPLHAGLKLASERLSLARNEVQVFVVVVTDGITDNCLGVSGETEPYLTNCRNCIGVHPPADKFYWDASCIGTCCFDDDKYATEIENKGALIFGIVVGVGDGVDRRYIRQNISSFEVLYAESDSFAQIESITKTLVEKTCLDVYAIEPNNLCLYETDYVTVFGTGFLEVPMFCHVLSEDRSTVLATFDAEVVDDYTIRCYVVFDPLLFHAEKFYPFEVNIYKGPKSKGMKPLMYYDCNATNFDELECIKDDAEGACKGKSDIIFVLDTSYSVDNTEWGVLRDFTYNVTKKLCIDPERQFVSIVEFTTGCKGGLSTSLFNLTGDRVQVLRTTRNLGRCGAGATPLHAGLAEAATQIRDFSRADAQPYVIVVSDGVTDSCQGVSGTINPTGCASCIGSHVPSDQYYWNCGACCLDDKFSKNSLEQLGGLIFGIVVGDPESGEVDQRYIREEISSHMSLYASANSFEEISTVTDLLVEKTCLDVWMIEPNNLCEGEDHRVVVTGTGFLPIDMLCGVGGYGAPRWTFPARLISDVNGVQQLECNITYQTEFQSEALYGFEISLTDGVRWSSGRQTILFYVRTSVLRKKTTHSTFLKDCNDAQNVTADCKCKGLSDIIFVFDTSASVDDGEWSKLREFSYNVTEQLCVHKKYGHVGVVEFTTNCQGQYAKVIMELSGNKGDAKRTVRNLARCGKGETPMHAGLELAYQEIVENGREDAYKFIVILSDGVTDSCKGKNVALNSTEMKSNCSRKYEECADVDPYCYSGIAGCCSSDIEWKNKLETDHFAYIYSLVVGSTAFGDETDPSYMQNEISSHPSYFAQAESFEEINEVAKRIVDATCIDIYFLDPAKICGKIDARIFVYGTGFADIEDKLFCRINLVEEKESDSPNYYEVPALFEDMGSMNCFLPYADLWPEDNTGKLMGKDKKYDFQVSVGGNFWSPPVLIVYSDCTQGSKFPRWLPVSASVITLVVLLSLFAMAICMLLSLLVLKYRKQSEKVQTSELKILEQGEIDALPEPEPDPEPEAFVPKENVRQEGYYLGGRAMTIDWEKGDGTSYNEPDVNDAEDALIPEPAEEENPFDSVVTSSYFQQKKLDRAERLKKFIDRDEDGRDNAEDF